MAADRLESYYLPPSVFKICSRQVDQRISTLTAFKGKRVKDLTRTQTIPRVKVKHSRRLTSNALSTTPQFR